MKRLVDGFELEDLEDGASLLSNLLKIIVGQQLSVKAARTIFGRFRGLYGRGFPNVDKIIKTPKAKLRGVGLSNSKAEYVKNVCRGIKKKELGINKYGKMENEEIREELIKIKGIGEWSVEMFLIFSLKRGDVFSIGDLGLRTAISRTYKVDRDNLEKLIKISDRWKPYRSTACRYLWKSLDNK